MLEKYPKSTFLFVVFCLFWKVALKRQQAVEDAIALQLVSKETGETLTSLPQGRIYGMKTTDPLLNEKSDCDFGGASNTNISVKNLDKLECSRGGYIFFCFGGQLDFMYSLSILFILCY